MTLNEYQEKAMSTCMATCANFSYMFLNLMGEVGEFASKVAKAIRKEQMNLDKLASRQQRGVIGGNGDNR